MTKRMLIDGLHAEEMRVAIADDRQIFDFDFATSAKQQIKGNIYLAKITRVEPSLQAAFVEYGGGKQGFLPFSEIHSDYYQIPLADRQKLMEEAEREGEAREEADDRALQGGPDFTSPDGFFPATEGIVEFNEDDQESALPALPVLPPALPELSHDDFSTSEEPEMPEAAEPAASYIAGVDEEHPAPPFTQDTYLDPDVPYPVGQVLPFPPTADHPLLEGGEPRVSLPTLEAPDENEEEPQAPDADTQATEVVPAAENTETPVENIASEDEEISGRRQRNNFFRRYKIQEVIKRGQVVLVQVIKEERGNKGASLTTYLSLAGRYCVLMPNSPKDGGISRKIADPETRRRLKSQVAEMKLAKGMSVIIRTAGVDRTRAEIRRDFDYLVKVWNKVRDVTVSSTAPALIYEESDLVKRAIRDQYTSDIDEVLVEGDAAYRNAKEFMKLLLPSHTPRVKHYRDSMPLFAAYGIEDQLMSMHDPVVKLRSGGYIVLSPTEALISIDVNSGRSTGERNIEETATKTNLEAAAEIARQLRLRDLAGLIVIDFIDMLESRNRRNVERAVKDALRADRAKIQLGRISPFGLLEMSRQRLRPSISEASTVACPHCLGRGNVRSSDSMSIQIVRSLEKEASTGSWQGFKLITTESIALYLLNHKRGLLSAIEERFDVQIAVEIDHSLQTPSFTIERSRKTNAPQQAKSERDNYRERGRQRRSERDENRPERVQFEDASPEDPAEVSEEETALETSAEANGEGNFGDRPKRRRGRRGGQRRRRGRDSGENQEGNFSDSPDEFASSQEDEGAVTEGEFADTNGNRASDEEGAPRPRRGQRGGRRRSGNRGGRYEDRDSGEPGRSTGRRRWRNQDGSPSDEPSSEAPRMEEPYQAEAYAVSQAPSQAAYEPAYEAPRHYASEPEMREPRPLETVSSTPAVQPPSPPPAPATERAAGTPARKGWWQRMIELD